MEQIHEMEKERAKLSVWRYIDMHVYMYVDGRGIRYLSWGLIMQVLFPNQKY